MAVYRPILDVYPSGHPSAGISTGSRTPVEDFLKALTDDTGARYEPMHPTAAIAAEWYWEDNGRKIVIKVPAGERFIRVPLRLDETYVYQAYSTESPFRGILIDEGYFRVDEETVSGIGFMHIGDVGVELPNVVEIPRMRSIVIWIEPTNYYPPAVVPPVPELKDICEGLGGNWDTVTGMCSLPSEVWKPIEIEGVALEERPYGVFGIPSIPSVTAVVPRIGLFPGALPGRGLTPGQIPEMPAIASPLDFLTTLFPFLAPPAIAPEIPAEYITEYELDTVLVARGLSRTDIASFMKEPDVESLIGEKGFMTRSELDTVLARDGYITEIPAEHITESELDTVLATRGLTSADIASFIDIEDVRTELDDKGYMTSTDLNLALADYLKEVPAEYITEAEIGPELAARGYITEIPAEFISEAELAARGFVTEIPPEFLAEKLSQASFITPSGLNTVFTDPTYGVQGAIQRLDKDVASNNMFSLELSEKIYELAARINSLNVKIDKPLDVKGALEISGISGQHINAMLTGGTTNPELTGEIVNYSVLVDEMFDRELTEWGVLPLPTVLEFPDSPEGWMVLPGFPALDNFAPPPFAGTVDAFDSYMLEFVIDKFNTWGYPIPFPGFPPGLPTTLDGWLDLPEFPYLEGIIDYVAPLDTTLGAFFTDTQASFSSLTSIVSDDFIDFRQIRDNITELDGYIVSGTTHIANAAAFMAAFRDGLSALGVPNLGFIDEITAAFYDLKDGLSAVSSLGSNLMHVFDAVNVQFSNLTGNFETAFGALEALPIPTLTPPLTS